MTPDERFAEKMRARAEGRAPVVVAAPALPRGNSPEAVDARFKAKLARHGKPEPKGDGKPSAEPKPEAKSDGKGEQGQPTKPEPQPKGDSKGRRG